MRQVSISTCSHTGHRGWAARGSRASTDATGTATDSAAIVTLPLAVTVPVLQVCVVLRLRRRLRFFRWELNTKIIPSLDLLHAYYAGLLCLCLCCIVPFVACGLSPTPIHHPIPDSLPALLLTLSHTYPPPLPLPPHQSRPPTPPPTSIPILTTIHIPTPTPPPPPPHPPLNPHPNPHLSA